MPTYTPGIVDSRLYKTFLPHLGASLRRQFVLRVLCLVVLTKSTQFPTRPLECPFYRKCSQMMHIRRLARHEHSRIRIPEGAGMRRKGIPGRIHARASIRDNSFKFPIGHSTQLNHPETHEPEQCWLRIRP